MISLRFGGVDATYTPPGGTPLHQTGQSNEFQIFLGLPITTGTSIIVNKVVTTAQANNKARAAFFTQSPFARTRGKITPVCLPNSPSPRKP